MAPRIKIVFGFKSLSRLSMRFGQTFRESRQLMNVVYKYDCKGCNGCYIGQTTRGVETRKMEHLRAFRGIGHSRIVEHCLNYKHDNDWNANIIAIEPNDNKRLIKETLLMDHFSKNGKTVYSQKSFELNVF
jgi:hypothetical protein